jgi:hypothetical protein
MYVVLKKYISFFFRMFRAKHVISFLPWISKILIAKTIDLSIRRGVLCYNYDWKRYDNHSHYIYIQWIMSAERICRPTIHLISSQWLRLDHDLSCRNWGYMFCKFMISACVYECFKHVRNPLMIGLRILYKKLAGGVAGINNNTLIN